MRGENAAAQCLDERRRVCAGPQIEINIEKLARKPLHALRIPNASHNAVRPDARRMAHAVRPGSRLPLFALRFRLRWARRVR